MAMHLYQGRRFLQISLGGAVKRYVATTSAFQSSYAVPEMPPCDFQPQPYKGPNFEDVAKTRKEKLSPAMLTYYKKPVLVHQGHQQWLYDHDGKRYLDLFAGIVTVSVGHCHPKVLNALNEQTKLLWHTTNIYYHPRVHEMAEKLIDKMPGDLKVVYFVNSGSEANDLAMFMARLHTGNYDIISFRNAYHGMSPYVMGLTALTTWRHKVPVSFGIHQAMNADVYRGVWGGSACRDSPVQTDRTCDCGTGPCIAADMYAEQLDDVIRHGFPKNGVAALFAEAIQGVGGTAQFPKGFLKKAFDITRANGGVCISDEVQTGFGRTGDHYWGFEGHGVMPDIVTMAKGIGNGFPMAAVVTTPEVAQTLSGALHFNTFGGNPMSCAVGSAVIDVIDEEKLQQNSLNVGTYFLEELAKLRDEFPIVGDVRGKGLMIGVEMVKDKNTRDPLPAEEVNSIWEATKDMGVLLGKGGLYGTVFRIKPPMCVTREDAAFGVSVLRKAIADHLASK